MSCSSCFSFLSPPRGDDEQQQQEFSTLVGFLATVSIFKEQISPSQLPDIAAKLTRRRWKPGQELVRCGRSANEFFLIESGKAFVFNQGTASAVAELTVGDYFGARQLIHDEVRRWGFTIVSAGPETLVTLSMTRRLFQRSGLHKLKAPKRPALFGYTAGPSSETLGLGPRQPVTKEDKTFLREVLQRNDILKQLLDNDSRVSSVVNHAKRRTVQAGADIFRSDRVADDLLIVQTGSFDVIHADTVTSISKSAEAAAARSLQETEEARAKALQEKRSMLTVKSVPAKLSGADETSHTQATEEGNDEEECAVPSRFLSGLVMSSTPSAKTRLEKRHKSLAAQAAKAAITLKVGDTVTWASSSRSIRLEAPVGRSRSIRLDGRRKSFIAGFGLTGPPKNALLQAQPPETEPEVEVGVVIDVVDNRVVVRFTKGDQHYQRVAQPSELVRQNKNKDKHLKPGDCFGEVSIVYNTRLGSTLKCREDSVVLTVPKRCLKVAIRGEHPCVDEFDALLREVDLLQPLLTAERRELARTAKGRKSFLPGECILVEGQVRTDRKWYVVEKGDCTVSTKQEGMISVLHRGGHFGEFSVLFDRSPSGNATQQVTVTAGVAGMTCLEMDTDILQRLRHELHKSTAGESSVTLTHTNSVGLNAVDYYKGEEEKAEGQEKKKGQEIPFDRLVTKKVLGRGGFGRVTLELDTLRGDMYALKKMSKALIEDEDMTRRVAAEREIMSLMDSSFIITFFRSFKDDEYVYFLMEPVLGGHLLEALETYPHIFSRDSPRGSSTCFYAACITEGLDHLHGHHIVYRDMKCENVLLDANGYAKICDLGFARFCLNKCNTFLGTPQYMAPEMIDSPHRHDFMVDWWALGVIVYELLAGRTPFDDEGIDEDDAYNFVKAIRRSQNEPLNERALPREINLATRNFICDLLNVDPGWRLGAKGAEQVRRHPWFRSMKMDFDMLHDQTMSSPVCPDCSVEEDGTKSCELRQLDEDLFRERGDRSTTPSAMGGGATPWDAAF